MNRIEHLLLALSANQINLLSDILSTHNPLQQNEEEFKTLCSMFGTARRRVAQKISGNIADDKDQVSEWEKWQRQQKAG